MPCIFDIIPFFGAAAFLVTIVVAELIVEVVLESLAMRFCAGGIVEGGATVRLPRAVLAAEGGFGAAALARESLGFSGEGMLATVVIGTDLIGEMGRDA